VTALSHAEHGQGAYRIRFDWGLTGARALAADARPADVAVVVDVLSFTTTLTVAVERGIAVYPFPWAKERAAAYAEERGAVLARGRREGLAVGAVSLSPVSFEAASGIARVVLPSPNGSTIAFALAEAGVRVVGACLRNAPAVGRWLAAVDGRVSVVAAGERWPDGSLRPAVEDLWGAGAVLAALFEVGGTGTASPEARSAVAAYDAVRGGCGSALPDCASGRELVAAGFGRDVELAAATDVSSVVPLLDGEAFVDAAAQSES
jgi:2-phosphosulfolactate phosphatase